MKAEELLKPRFEVIADYPFNPYQIGGLVENVANTNIALYAKTNNTEHLSSIEFFEKFPHLFRKLNWWEKRSKEDMPMRLICKAIENDTKVMEIKEWDMDILVGWLDKEARKCCSLLLFNPEYGYFPVD